MEKEIEKKEKIKETEKKEDLKTRIKKNADAIGKKVSYKYTDLAQINEYLDEQGIKYYQEIITEEGKDYVYTTPIIDGKKLKPRRGAQVVDATLYGNDNPAQKQGSAITYARRYSLLMAFGLATEDDDAASLSSDAEIVKKQTVRPASDSQKNYINSLLKTDEEKIRFFKVKTIEEANLVLENLSAINASSAIKLLLKKEA